PGSWLILQYGNWALHNKSHSEWADKIYKPAAQTPPTDSVEKQNALANPWSYQGCFQRRL
ncbi:hypothetical protein, partial [Agriterribacter sp.]|uniref:hypothetical protein n=1 Tax=Agriterribacter sp. TaxID=2821509 RepID=UPI002D1FB426